MGNVHDAGGSKAMGKACVAGGLKAVGMHDAGGSKAVGDVRNVGSSKAIGDVGRSKSVGSISSSEIEGKAAMCCHASAHGNKSVCSSPFAVSCGECQG